MNKLTRKQKTLVAAAVVALHLAPLMRIALAEGAPPQKKHSRELYALNVVLIAKDTRDSSGSTANCPRRYHGIGVQHFGDRIIAVAPGWPASRAGIKVDDIFTDGVWNIERGDYYKFRITKPDGTVTKYALVPEEICFEDGV